MSLGIEQAKLVGKVEAWVYQRPFQRQHQRQCRHWMLSVRWIFLIPLLVLLSGCTWFSATEQTNVPLELDFADTLPHGWQALDTWREVNIDGDDDVEYLLLFKYDNGQVGGAVYDPQISSEYVGVVDLSATPVPTATVEIVSVPLQPFAYYRPYRLLPNYRAYLYGEPQGHGFLASPRDVANIVIAQVKHPQSLLESDANTEATGDGDNSDRDNGGEDTSGADGESLGGDSGGGKRVQPAAELVIRGGRTHLTFVWWKNIHDGYGVTQLFARGGFRGIDWGEWQASPEPITSILALEPLEDYRARTVLCREYIYERLTDVVADNGQTSSGSRDPTMQSAEASATNDPIIEFRRADIGINFCEDRIPSHPFYPEGVVLAYLLGTVADQDVASLEILLTPGIAAAQLNADIDINRLRQETVDDIATPPTLPVLPSSMNSGSFSPTTAVCVELADPSVNQSRWLLFTLRYQPPELTERLPDRWTISGVSVAPPPVVTPDQAYCEVILERSLR